MFLSRENGSNSRFGLETDDKVRRSCVCVCVFVSMCVCSVDSVQQNACCGHGAKMAEQKDPELR